MLKAHIDNGFDYYTPDCPACACVYNGDCLCTDGAPSRSMTKHEYLSFLVQCRVAWLRRTAAAKPSYLTPMDVALHYIALRRLGASPPSRTSRLTGVAVRLVRRMYPNVFQSATNGGDA